MRTTVLPAIKGTLFYVPAAFGGMVLARVAGRTFGIAERLDGLKTSCVETLAALPLVSEGLARFGLNLLLLLVGIFVLSRLGNFFKASRKKREFARQHDLPGEAHGQRVWMLSLLLGVGSAALTAVVAVVAGMCLHGSFSLIATVYAKTAGAIHGGLDRVNPAMPNMIDGDVIKLVLAVVIVYLAACLFGRLASIKHPPIQMRFRVDGYMRPTRWLHPIAMMARKSALVLYSQSDRTRGLHGASVPIARITSKPYGGGKETEHYIMIRSDLEPQRVARRLTPQDVDAVKKYLSDYAAGGAGSDGIAPGHVVRLARESGIFKEAYGGKLVRDGQKLTPADVGNVVRQLSQSRHEDALASPTEELVEALRGHERYAHGGRFFATVFDGHPLTPTVMLKENIGQTLAFSRDPRQGFGPSFARLGRLIMVLQHRRFQSGTTHDESLDDWDEDMDDDDHGDDSSTPVNIIKEDRKAWNQILRNGLGEAYIIRMGDRQFVYDGWFVGSGEFLTAWIPFLRGRHLAPRRIGYVTDEEQKIVAKITDVTWKAPTKLIGNYDRIVDVYDSRLARDKNFGLTLSLLSQFMTHQNLYRRNRLNQIVPTVGSPAGADDDVAM